MNNEVRVIKSEYRWNNVQGSVADVHVKSDDNIDDNS